MPFGFIRLAFPFRAAGPRPGTALCWAFFVLLAAAPAAFAQHTDRAPDRLLARPDLQALVDRQVERDGASLVAALAASDPVVRARAAFALASVQDSAAVPALLGHLTDGDPRVRADAAFALGQSADSTAERALLSRLSAERDVTVRARLYEALGKTGGRASLAALAARAVSGVDRAAHALTLGRYGLRGVHDPAAVRVLASALTAREAGLRRDAAYYFGRIRPATAWAAEAGRVRSALDGYSPAEEAAMHLVLGLGRLGDSTDTGRLVRWLRTATDARTRTNAARALAGRTAEPSALAALRTALDDPSPHAARAAAEGLAAAPALSAETVAALRAWVDAHPRAWRTAGALAPGLVRGGEEAFVASWAARQSAPAARASGLAALGEATGSATRDTLLVAAAAPNVRVAAAALAALAVRWNREKAALSPPDRARYFAAFASGLRRRSVAAVSAAAPALADSLFGPLGGARVLAEVYRGLEAPRDAEAMVEVIRALGASGDPAVAEVLRAGMGSDAPLVARAAADALGRLTGVRVAPPATPEPPPRRVDWAALARAGARPRLVIETEKGVFVLELDAEQAPLTTQTLLQLAEAGRFDGVPFHRVVPNFVVQGGDVERGDGSGGPGFAIRSEFTRRPYERGTAGMASSGKDTEGSQYFVTHSMQPHLDGRYTAFGRVVTGLAVVDRIVEGDRALRVRVAR